MIIFATKFFTKFISIWSWVLMCAMAMVFTINVYSAPVISSVTPTTADISGGALLTVNGSGFVPNVVAGSLDTSFTVGTGANGIVRTSAIQSDGKIVIAGEFTTYNGVGRTRIARLNTDGTLDTSFTVGTGANSTIFTISIQSDGKIIIGGQFTNYNGTARNRVARLNTDGSLDTGFIVGTGAGNIVYASAIQSDGKILIGGSFTSYNGTARNRIARLNTNGSLDTTFVIGGGAQNEVRTISLQTDGKPIIGGLFTAYNSTARNRLARLNTDGSLDTTFTVGTAANNTVFTSTIQTDGKIIIGGAFTTYNGVGRVRLARVNTDGTLDTTFTVGTGANNNVFAVSVANDGKVVVGGQFTTYNGTARNRITRVNTDGSLDTGFAVGTGAGNILYTNPIQTDGKIIIGGNFTSYNGTAISRIARLNSSTLNISVTIGGNPCTSVVFVSSTQLTCTIPAGSSLGFADVVVVNPNLESFTLSNQFSYVSSPSIAFQIRNSADTANVFSCDLDVATTSTLSSCSYRLKVTSNITSGYFVFVSTSGNLSNGPNVIQNALVGSGGTGGSDISISTVGNERYGVRVLPGNITGGSVTLNPIFNAGANSVLFNYTSPTSLLESFGPNIPAGIDTINTSLITHNLNISASTLGGQYTQNITYTVVPKF